MIMFLMIAQQKGYKVVYQNFDCVDNPLNRRK